MRDRPRRRSNQYNSIYPVQISDDSVSLQLNHQFIAAEGFDSF